MRLGIGRHQRDAIGLAAGRLEIIDGRGIDREEAAGRAIFRRHVADGRLVRDRQMVEAGTEELDEFSDHALLAQHLRDREHEVGRGDAFLELSLELEADDFRQQHRQRLAEHAGFRLDAADAPAEHGKAVDHRRVRVGADQRVRIGDLERAGLLADLHLLLLGPHRLREIFEIDLVADAGAGRHHGEIRKRLLAPFQEFVAFLILLVFLDHVLAERLVVAEEVHDHRVVDHEIDRHQRIDLLGVAAEALHRVAHRGEIDHRRDAGEILHQDARRAEGDLMFERALLQPFRDRDDVVLLDGAAVLVAQQVLQQHLHRVGKLGDPLQTVLLGGGQAVIDVGLAANLEGLLAFEAVERGHVRRSQIVVIPGKGIYSTVSEAWPGARRARIVCRIKFRLIESFNNRRHTDKRARSDAPPKILVRYPRIQRAVKGQDAALGTGSQMCAGRPRGLFRPRFRSRRRRGAGGGRPQRIRQDVVIAPDCRRARPRRRIDRAGGRRRRAHACRAIALSRPPRRAEAGAERVGKPHLLARFSRRDDVESCRKSGHRRARSCGPVAGRIFVGRTAAKAFDRPFADGAAAGLAAR